MSNKTIGDYGEQLAVEELQRLGHHILTKNYRRLGAEIDIITEKSGVTYFVEVKARQGDYAPPALNVTPAKRRQIAKAATLWFLEQGKETNSGFLIIEVYLAEQKINLIEDFLI